MRCLYRINEALHAIPLNYPDTTSGIARNSNVNLFCLANDPETFLPRYIAKLFLSIVNKLNGLLSVVLI